MDIVEKLRAGHQYSGIVDPLDKEAANEIERLRAALAPFADCWDLWQGEKPPESRMLMFASEGGGTFLGYADVRHLRLAYEALHTDGQGVIDNGN